jgi:NAD+ kinase
MQRGHPDLLAVDRSWPPSPGHRRLGAPLPMLQRIGVLTHPTRDVCAALAEIARWGRRAGVRVVAEGGRVRLPPGIDPVPAASLARPGGILVALGGDGTMLHALAVGAVHGTPVLGVKLGHVSFLAEVEPAELGAALDALAAGRFAIEERTALAVRNGGPGTAVAVNDVVLRRASGAPLAEVGLLLGGEEVARYKGDGVIVATPTGSTGYNRSAGGPLVSPKLSATIVTPLAAREAPSAVLLSAGEPLELRVHGASAPLAVEIDGRAHSVAPPLARLRIDQSGPRSRLIRLGRTRFPPRP